MCDYCDVNSSRALLSSLALRLRAAAAVLLVAAGATGCIPFYGELTGGAHSLSGDRFDARFAPSAGFNFGMPLYFGPFGVAIGAGVDVMATDLPEGRMVVYSGGLVLRGAVGIGGDGQILQADVAYAGPGEVELNDGERAGSAHGLFVGATVGFGDASVITVSAGPHFLWGEHPDLDSISAWGGQLRLRFMNLAFF